MSGTLLTDENNIMSEDGHAKSSVVQDEVHFVFERHEKVNLMIEIKGQGFQDLFDSATFKTGDKCKLVDELIQNVNSQLTDKKMFPLRDNEFESDRDVRILYNFILNLIESSDYPHEWKCDVVVLLVDHAVHLLNEEHGGLTGDQLSKLEILLKLNEQSVKERHKVVTLLRE